MHIFTTNIYIKHKQNVSIMLSRDMQTRGILSCNTSLYEHVLYIQIIVQCEYISCHFPSNNLYLSLHKHSYKDACDGNLHMHVTAGMKEYNILQGNYYLFVLIER